MSEQLALAVDEPLVAPAKAPTAPAAAPVPETPEPAEGGEPAQNIEKQALSTLPEGEKPEAPLTPEQAAKREGRRYGRRLDAANRKYYEEKARAELLEKQIEELKAKSAPAPIEGEPRMEDFTDFKEYAKKYAEFESGKALKEYEKKQLETKARAEMDTLLHNWDLAVEKAASKYDDFDDVVGDFKPASPWGFAIAEAENGADIAYFLAKHPKEIERIVTLSPRAQIREIGKLEAKLLAEPPKPKTPSKAPAPITPLGGKSGGTSDVPLDTDDINTWMKKENARMRKTAGA